MADASISELTNVQKGKLAELYFEIECVKRGIQVFRPVLDARYDYVAMLDGGAKRIQVKWSDRKSTNSDAISIDLSRPRGSRNSRGGKGVALYSSEEIDFVFAYLPIIETFVVLQPSHFHLRSCISIKTTPTRQRLGVNHASAFSWDATFTRT